MRTFRPDTMWYQTEDPPKSTWKSVYAPSGLIRAYSSTWSQAGSCLSQSPPSNHRLGPEHASYKTDVQGQQLSCRSPALSMTGVQQHGQSEHLGSGRILGRPGLAHEVELPHHSWRRHISLWLQVSGSCQPVTQQCAPARSCNMTDCSIQCAPRRAEGRSHRQSLVQVRCQRAP